MRFSYDTMTGDLDTLRGWLNWGATIVIVYSWAWFYNELREMIITLAWQGSNEKTPK